VPRLRQPIGVCCSSTWTVRPQRRSGAAFTAGIFAHPPPAYCSTISPLARPSARRGRKTSILLPGPSNWANADLALCDVKGRELTLKHVLKHVEPKYDLIILDCPPNLSLIGVNALMAADALIIPVSPQFLAVEGLNSLLASLEKVRTRLATKNRILGILLTMVDRSAKGAMEIRDRVRAQYRDRIFHTEIDVSRSLADAPASAQTVLQFAPRSRAADTFRRLAGEVLDRAQR
jgi:chromosome partitioning protein